MKKMLRNLIEALIFQMRRKSFLIVLDQSFCSITNFLSNILIVRSCSKVDFGYFTLGMTIVLFIEVIQRSLITIPFAVLSRKDTDNEKALNFGSIFTQHITISFLTCLGFLMSAIFIGTPQDLRKILFSLSIASSSLLLKDFTRNAFLAKLDVRTVIRLGIVINSVSLSCLFLAYSTGGLSAARAYYIIAACSGLPAFGLIVLKRNQIRTQRRRLLNDLRRNIVFGKWTFGSVVMNALGLRAIPWLLLFCFGSGEVAVLAVILSLAGFINPIINGTASYLMPKLCNVDAEKGIVPALNMSNRVFELILIIALCYTIFIALFGEFFVSFLYTSRYSGFKVPLVITSFAVALNAINIPARAILRVAEHPEFEFYGSSIAAISALTFGALLIPNYAILGASLTYMASNFIVTVVNRAAFIYYNRINERNMIP